MGEIEAATQEYPPHGGNGKTEILADVVTHPKSQRWPVPKQVSNLVQFFGRKTHIPHTPGDTQLVGSTR